MSLDEVSQRKGHKDFVTVVSDIDRGLLLEVIDSHKQEDIVEILRQQALEVREQVEEVCVDMWGGFPKVVEEVFPNAEIVFDRFHVMKPVNEELNKIRKQVKITTKHPCKNKLDRSSRGRQPKSLHRVHALIRPVQLINA